MIFSDWSDYFFIIYVYLFIICIYYHFKMIILASNEKTKGHAILLDFRPYIQWIFDNIFKMMRSYVYQLHHTKKLWKHIYIYIYVCICICICICIYIYIYIFILYNISDFGSLSKNRSYRVHSWIWINGKNSYIVMGTIDFVYIYLVYTVSQFTCQCCNSRNVVVALQGGCPYSPDG